MAVRYALALFCFAAIVPFSVLARKLWRGEGLEFIAGNQFADKRELGLPYQRRMAREIAVMLAACNLMLAALGLCSLSQADGRTLLLVAAAFGSIVVAGGVAVTLRANKAAKADQEKADLQAQGWPVKDPNEGNSAKQWVLIALLYGISLPLICLIAMHFGG